MVQDVHEQSVTIAGDVGLNSIHTLRALIARPLRGSLHDCEHALDHIRVNARRCSLIFPIDDYGN